MISMSMGISIQKYYIILCRDRDDLDVRGECLQKYNTFLHQDQDDLDLGPKKIALSYYLDRDDLDL